MSLINLEVYKKSFAKRDDTLCLFLLFDKVNFVYRTLVKKY